MKCLVVLFALFAAVLAQDLSCRAKFLDSYVRHGAFYGSAVNGTISNKGYYSIIGQSMEANDYLSDNPRASATAQNSSYIVYDGVSGKVLFGGWSWSLCQNKVLYAKGMVNGKLIPCSTSICDPIAPSSKIISQLKTLYPIPGVPSRPGADFICAGLVTSEGIEEIVNVVWNLGANDTPLFYSVLSNSSDYEYKVDKIRPLTVEDAYLLKNHCDKTEVRKENEYSDLFDRINRVLPKLF